jgi:DNA polymerase-3 subunit delta
MTMIARQYRIIIKVKDAMVAGPGSENEIAKRVQEHPFVVKKAMQQARQYTFDELHMIMNRLLETDYAMKTGYDTDTLVDMLVADLTRNAVG